MLNIQHCLALFTLKYFIHFYTVNKDIICSVSFSYSTPSGMFVLSLQNVQLNQISANFIKRQRQALLHLLTSRNIQIKPEMWSGRPSPPPTISPFPCWFVIKCDDVYTDKKENRIFLIYKEIQRDRVQSHILLMGLWQYGNIPKRIKLLSFPFDPRLLY